VGAAQRVGRCVQRRRRLRWPVLDGGAAAPVFLLRDEFVTDEAAPIASPRTCEPGPGTCVVTDTLNVLSVSGGRLVATSGAGYGDPGVWGDLFTRAVGMAVFGEIIEIESGRELFGFDTDRSSLPNQALFFFGNNLYAYENTQIEVGGCALNTSYVLSVVQRTAGTFYLIRGGVYTNWTLLYVANVLNYTQMYPCCVGHTKGWSAGYMRRAQLASSWATDYGIATNRVESAAVDELTSSEADAIIEATWTAVTGETWELRTRRTDVDNRWIVRCSQADSTIKLIERNAGVVTERSSAAQTWTNGTAYRLVVIQDDETIKTYVADVVKNSYASAAFNKLATGVKTSHAVSNLVCWPRTLSGAALAELEKYTT